MLVPSGTIPIRTTYAPPKFPSYTSFAKKIPRGKVGYRPRVAMTTNDKHSKQCQTFNVKKEKIDFPGEGLSFTIGEGRVSRVGECAMIYDETLEVNAPEIESPESGDEEVVQTAMSKFNPPVRHTAKHDFDSDSETESELDNFLDNASGEDLSPDRKSQKLDLEKPLELPKQSSRETEKIEKLERKKSARNRASLESSNSDDDSVDQESARPDPALPIGRKPTAGVVIPGEGAYDPKHFQNLKLPPDIENIFGYIMKYTPQKIDIDFKLQPFIPEYVPAVGDIDAFIKVTTPACNVRGQPIAEHVLEHIDNLGLTVLDEPSAEQSDSALLHLQLRAISKTTSAKSTVLTKKIENAEKNQKAIDRWIKDVSELHLSKPAPTVTYTSKMPDIDTLMEEWPESIEETLNDVGFPPPALDCSLSQYVDIVCGLFDIPIVGDTLNDRIQALHLLFSLYSAVKNNQLFEERQEKEAV